MDYVDYGHSRALYYSHYSGFPHIFSSKIKQNIVTSKFLTRDNPVIRFELQWIHTHLQFQNQGKKQMIL